MRKAQPWLLMLTALLLGWAIGSFASDHFYEQWIKKYLARTALAAASDRLMVLNALHGGDTNQAAEFLEGQLDVQIMALSATWQDMPASNRPAADTRLLGQLRDYRTAHPRKTNRPELDSKIAEILAVTNTVK